MPDIEISFPRGGELIKEAKETRKRKIRDPDDDENIKKPTLSDEYESVFTKPFSSELLTDDLRGLAVVKKIDDLSVTLETAGGSQLLLNPKNISPEFTKTLGQTSLDEVFHVGQLLAFRLVQKANEKKNEKVHKITIEPTAVNRHLVPAACKNAIVLNGSVQSIEEKGALINLGMGKVTGFVKAEDLPPTWALSKLRLGQVLMFRVRKSGEAISRVLDLSAYVEADVYSEESALHLMPGVIVNVEPERAVKSGVFVSFCDKKAFIHKSHLPPRLRLNPDRFVKQIRAIVLFVVPNSPILILSALPDIVNVSKIERRLLPSDFKIGTMIKGTVYDVDKAGNIRLFFGDLEKPELVTAKLPKTQFDDYEKQAPKFDIGTVHELRILGYNAIERCVYLSAKKTDLKRKILDPQSICQGQKVTGIVERITEKGLIVKFSIGAEDGGYTSGFIASQQTVDKPIAKWANKFSPQQRVPARIISFDVETGRLFATAKPGLVNSNLAIINGFNQSFVGEEAHGTVLKKLPDSGLLVGFYNYVAGVIPASSAAALPDAIEGSVVKVKVLKVTEETRKMLLGLSDDVRPVRTTEGKSTKKSKNSKMSKPFAIVKAKVVGPWPYGGTAASTTAELLLADGAIGRLHVSEIDLNSYEIGSTPMVEFLKKTKDSNIEVKIISVGKAHRSMKRLTEAVSKSKRRNFYECTAKEFKLWETRDQLTLINYKSQFLLNEHIPIFVGDAAKMQPENQPYVEFEVNPLVVGRLPKVYLKKFSSQKKSKGKTLLDVNDCEMLFNNGEMCNAFVVRCLAGKASKSLIVGFGDTILAESDCMIIEMGEEKKKKLKEKKKKQKLKKKNKVKEEIKEEEFDKETESALKPRRSTRKKTTLSAKLAITDPGFDFSLGEFSMDNLAKVGKEEIVDVDSDDDDVVDGNAEDDEGVEEESEIEESEDEEIKDEPMEVEDSEDRSRRLQERERRLKEAIPENPMEFDQLLVKAPNSADLWVKHINKCLLDERVDDARKMVERALSTIDGRQIAEHMKIWDAFLNLEVMFGNEQSLSAAFADAVRRQNPLVMHRRFAKILLHHQRDEELDALYEEMVKKFRGADIDVWHEYGQRLYETNRGEAARELMNRALTSVQRKNHVTILSRFAQLEYRFGDAERAKTMFEKILQTYKRRMDIWNVYLDMSLKHAGIVETRRIYELLNADELGASRYRKLLEKWHKMEEQNGEEELAAEVQKRIDNLVAEDADDRNQ